MLDIWIGEAQLLAGGAYLAASRARKAGSRWNVLAVFGALVIVGFAVPIIPVLFGRAPFVFRVPAIIYLAVSLFILTRALRAA
jgi:hypothetical protein